MTLSKKSFAHAKAFGCAAFLCASVTALASDRAIDHAPIGVMADHTHDRGEFMLSYRAMRMEMQGSRDGTRSLTPEQIATTVPNRFAERPGQPPTLRVVPEDMTMTMHMLGMMYAPLENLTLMAMLKVIDNKMDHTTFRGGMGASELGTFETGSDGLGDTRVGALTRLGAWDNGGRLHSLFGVSIPTGDIKEADQILAPNGATPVPRLPYPIQLDSGSWVRAPGICLRG